MDTIDLRLGDIVLFELPAGADVDRLCDALWPRWPGWWAADGDARLVAAKVREDENDLARLLREAQALMAELDLPALVFWLDDRDYVLEALPQHDLVASAPFMPPGPPAAP
jgi:hypothetical protein